MSSITINTARLSRDVSMILTMLEHIEDNIAKKIALRSCLDITDAIAEAWFMNNCPTAEANFRAVFNSMDFDTKRQYVKKSSFGEHVVMHNLFPEMPIML